MQLPDFPNLKESISFPQTNLGMYYYIERQPENKIYVMPRDFMKDLEHIDSQMLLDFTSDVFNGRVFPNRKEEWTKVAFDSNAIRIYTVKNLDDHFANRYYMDRDLLLLFYKYDVEVPAALGELATDLRGRNLNEFTVGKINMRLNDVSEHFPVYQYPSLYFIRKQA